MEQYNPSKIEKKWQRIWQKQNFACWQAKDFSKKPKRYVLDMFPYPSGEGLHVGHIEGYTASDIYSRYLRMRGFNVLHPMGWDAFGLPAENYAIKTKTHPEIIVKKNVKRFKNQLQSLGFSYDWQREINTTDPAYYKWTQWIFLKIFGKGLAYNAEAPVNWCPSCKTVLANEEVVGGKCERCGALVKRKNLRQWMLRITAYAQKLLDDLKDLAWPEAVKEMQKRWIGRSEGAIISFKLQASSFKIDVFTTRTDTLFGATYLVLAPEHPFVAELLKVKSHPPSPKASGDVLRSFNEGGQKSKVKNYEEIKKYIEKAKNKSDRERTTEIKDKTGVELKGLKAINPANGREVSVWVADYILAHYGTGAVMAVPAHDQRDREFAKRYNLSIQEVIAPRTDADYNADIRGKINKAFEDDGVLINSGQFNGLRSEKAREEIIKWLVKKNLGKKTINYKLRDWVFSRQRYWGEPMPLVFCENCAARIKNNELKIKNEGMKLNPGWIPVPEKDLPLKLPEIKKYEPTGTGESPLAAVGNWVNTKCPQCGGPAKRETNTMPQWAGSCWYYLAYLLGNQKSKIKNQKFIWDKKKFKYWLPVDLYLGGVEHAVLHLLYARFWHKFLYDQELVPTKEPFQKLVNQGLILGADSQKMSKSRGNIVNPDFLIKEFGADSLRLYEMFMGPLEDAKPWDPQGIVGMHRFLQRVWRLFEKIKNQKFHPPKFSEKIWEGKKIKIKEKIKDNIFEKKLHQTIKKVTEDIENFKFNTAISSLMILLNEAEKQRILDSRFYFLFSKLLAPFAPHIAEELWQVINKQQTTNNKQQNSVHLQSWPKYDPKLIKEDIFELVIQVNGKIRNRISAPINISQSEAQKLALNQERIKKFLNGKDIKRIIFIPQKLINIVI